MKEAFFLVTYVISMYSCHPPINADKKNPYYNIEATPYLYYGMGNANSNINAIGVKKVDGSIIYLDLPDSVSSSNVTGIATYDINVNEELKITKAEMTSLSVKDTVSNNILEYYKYNKSSKFIYEVGSEESKYDIFFQSVIDSFKIEVVDERKELDKIIYCKFYF